MNVSFDFVVAAVAVVIIVILCGGICSHTKIDVNNTVSLIDVDD